MSVTVIGDATRLPFDNRMFDAVITSPTYGNRMADHHDAQDGSKRITYRHSGRHPSRWSAAVLERIRTVWRDETCSRGHRERDELVLDPFAGVGAPVLEAALTRATVIGVEMDRDWAQGVDRPVNKPLHERNTGRMQWGETYRVMHMQAWREAARVVRMGGRMVLNVSDHIRSGTRQRVVAWHIATLIDCGFQQEVLMPVSTPRMRMGDTGDLRVPCEYVVTFRRIP